MTTFWVNADTGDDTNDGSEGSPWKTLSHAKSNSIDGDTIILQTATATYDVPNFEGRTWRGDTTDPENHVIDGGGNVISQNHEVDTTYENLVVQNIIGSLDNALFVLPQSNPVSVTFKRVFFRDFTLPPGGGGGGQGGLLADDGVHNEVVYTALLDTCSVHNFSLAASPSSSFLFGSRSSLAGSLFTIRGTTIDIPVILDGIFQFVDPGETLEIVNSIINNRAGSTFDWNSGFGGSPIFDVTYSDFYRIDNIPAGASGGTGVITSDPLLVDPANDNFNLRPDSPCINTGTLL